VGKFQSPIWGKSTPPLTVKSELDVWLAHRGLSLSEEKTRIVHLTEGFDFLGFNIRHYAAPKTSQSGYKLLIKPSKKSVAAMRAHLRTEWRSLKGQTVQTVLKRLNPIIRGEANYYRIAVASKLFNHLDHWMWHREQCYARKRHPSKPLAQAKILGQAQLEAGRSLGVW
jgi:RNA-directed DNA polymerase